MICVRCRTDRRDTILASFWLCNACNFALTQQAFGGAAPAFEGFEAASYCALCNEQRDLHLYQWYLCPYCGRLVNSYRLGRVSQGFAAQEWERHVAPYVPSMAIEVIDAVMLAPYNRGGRRRALAHVLDFRVTEDGAPVVWVELKTGQRAIGELATFQLDHSDCDDILNVVRSTNLPAYVFHAQLGREYQPPSDRIVTHGIWWTDIYAMTDAFLRSERRRQNGGKMAAHFSPGCFAPLGSLGAALRDGHHRALRARLEREGPPVLYRL